MGIEVKREVWYIPRMSTLEKLMRFFGPEVPQFQVMYLTGRTLKQVQPNICPLDEEGRVVREEELYMVTIESIRKV